MDRLNKPVIGISTGDINGIGPELILKTFLDARLLKYCTPVVFADGRLFNWYKKQLNISNFSFNQITDYNQINPKRINLVQSMEEEVNADPGRPTPQAGQAAWHSLQQMVKCHKEGYLDAVLTGPIDKKNIQGDDFTFPGHTEFFSRMFDDSEPLMLMAHNNLRLGVVTGHMPLHLVPKAITPQLVEKKLSLLYAAIVKDFCIDKPKIAVLGLNPHAGEEGLLGSEDRDIIFPVIDKWKNKGHFVFGPYPADGFFARGEQNKFDGILAMYHDQGLTPFKILSHGHGVNFTAGLPIVRTSPAHGTAYSIAGKGIADVTSFRNALFMAIDVWKRRNPVADQTKQ